MRVFIAVALEGAVTCELKKSKKLFWGEIILVSNERYFLLSGFSSPIYLFLFCSFIFSKVIKKCYFKQGNKKERQKKLLEDKEKKIEGKR